MLFKTKGIVLSHIKYRETSIIARLYTEEFGLQSYIVNSVRSKNSKTKIALFQPLTLLDLVVYHKPNGALQRISEVKCCLPFKDIPFEIRKSAIAIFIGEVLIKTMKEESSNKGLFHYLYNSIAELDNMSSNIENYHLRFLVDLSGYLGFMPSTAEDILHSGLIKPYSETEKLFLNSLIGSDSIPINNSTRRNCLEYLLDFYAAHVENFGTVNSIKVLKEVLS